MAYTSKKIIGLSLSLLLSSHAMRAVEGVTIGIAAAVGTAVAGGVTYMFSGESKNESESAEKQREAIPGMASTYDRNIMASIREWRDDTGLMRDENRAYRNRMLLHGPPGNGKTTIAKKLAEEAGCKFTEYSGSSLVDKYVASGPCKLRSIFDEAIQHYKATGERTAVFIDEIDAIAAVRDQGNGAHEYENTQIELCIQLDKYADDNRIFVIAATNHFDRLDQRVQRRLAREAVEIPNPDAKQREDVIKYHFRKINKMNFEEVCPGKCRENFIAWTPGFSNSDLEDVSFNIKKYQAFDAEGKITPKYIEMARKYAAEGIARRNKQENEKKDRESLSERRDRAAIMHSYLGSAYSFLGSIKFIKDILGGEIPSPNPEPK